MSDLQYRASDAQGQAEAYVAALLAALGSRDPLEVLREMPDAVRRALAGLSPAQLATPEAPGKWSMCQVVQHLSDSDLVGAFRFRMILAHDRPALAGYDQDLWVERVHRGDTDVDAALADFTVLRQANMRLLERTTPEDRQRVGLHAERGPESIESLMRLFAGHDIVHLRQLARIRQAVAPAEAAG
ncbi:MAG TPA: DinB family protein [Thermoanaerobaculia bacterium]